jgi:hypothetical protein
VKPDPQTVAGVKLGWREGWGEEGFGCVFVGSLEEKVYSNPTLFEAVALQRGAVAVSKGLRRVRGNGGPRSR